MWFGTIAVPWAGKNSRLTRMFESFALKLFEACRCVKQAVKLLGMGWDAVERGLERTYEETGLMENAGPM